MVTDALWEIEKGDGAHGIIYVQRVDTAGNILFSDTGTNVLTLQTHTKGMIAFLTIIPAVFLWLHRSTMGLSGGIECPSNTSIPMVNGFWELASH
jgi:hypothetical protein